MVLAVAITAGGAGMVVHLTHVLQSVERSLVDARFSLRPAQPRPHDVALVTIDKQYAVLHRNSGQLAQRSEVARAVTLLRHDGASVIVLDLDLAAGSDPSQDLTLATAIEQARNVVYGLSDVQASGPHGGDYLMFGSQWGSALAPRLRMTAGSSLNYEPIRSVPYEIRYGTSPPHAYPVLARAVVERLRGEPVPRSAFAGDAWIDYYGPAGTLPRVRFADLLAGRTPRRAIEGKVAVVGVDNPLLDRHVTSVRPTHRMAGVEVVANEIETVLRGFPLRSTPGWQDASWIFLLAAAFPLVAMAARVRWAAFLALLAVGAYAWFVQVRFNAGQVLPVTGPLAGVAASVALTIGLRYRRLAREEQRLRLLFAEADPATVEAVLDDTSAGPGAATRIVAGYRVEALIVEGGMGAVYRATQLALNRSVALKLIRPEYAQDARYRERFVREAGIAASLEHPNVIPIYEAGDASGILFIAMRYVDGSDLEARLRVTGPMELDDAVSVVSQLAAAVEAAHQQGLVHRDIKPANVLLTLDDPAHVYLTDFGVARANRGTGLTSDGEMLGSVAYMAPEQIRGEAITPATDVYALGGVLFTTLCGRLPYERDGSLATMWAHVNGDLPRASEYTIALPPSVDAVVARAMAKAPRDRFASAAEFAQALRAAVTGVPIAPCD